MQKPILYFMTGIAGSGKSTLIDLYTKETPFVVISTDVELEMIARNLDISYNEAFTQHFGHAEALMKQKLNQAVKDLKNIVWDQTNLTKKSRARKLRSIGKDLKNYVAIAIAFDYNPNDWNVLKDRNLKRAKETGKYVPEGVLETMWTQYEKPTLDEGFDHVYTYNISGVFLDKEAKLA